MHITDTYKQYANQAGTWPISSLTCFPAITFFSCRFFPPRALEIVGRGCGSLSNSLGVWWCPSPSAAEVAWNAGDIQPDSCSRGAAPVQRARCFWQPPAACYSYSRRRATPETAETSSGSESQEHAFSGHHPLAITSLYCSPESSLHFLRL